MVGTKRASFGIFSLVVTALGLAGACTVTSDAGDSGGDDAGASGEAGSSDQGGSAGNTGTGGAGARGGAAGAANGGNTATGGASGDAGAGDGGGGVSGEGGQPGGAAGVGGQPGGAGGGAGKGAVGVPCGADNCDPATEHCVFRTNMTAACTPKTTPCVGGCVVLDCDGPEDCTGGQLCRYSLGESEYFLCSSVTSDYGIPCSSSADCKPAYPTCRNFTNTMALTELGWQPRFCSN
jgi:hypothetical protein